MSDTSNSRCGNARCRQFTVSDDVVTVGAEIRVKAVQFNIYASKPNCKEENVKELTRRDFVKFGAAGMAVVATTARSQILGGLPLAGHGSEFFTIAVISDTQNYVDGTQPQPLNESFFLDQTRYLAEKKHELNLRFVTHVGDVVEHGDGSTIDYPAKYGTTQDIEWVNATKAIDVLDAARIPFGLSIGNHDFDNMYYSAPGGYPPLVSTASWWKKHFGSGSKYFRGKPWYGGASDEVGYISTGSGVSGTGEYPPAGTPCNYGLSSYQFFTAGGKKFLHISLELEANNDAIAWAQRVIDSYPDYATIVTTHSYIAPPAWGDNNPFLDSSDPAKYNAPQWLIGSPNGYNAAENIWAKLIAPNNQIFLVLCGHSWTSTSNTTTLVEPCGPGVSKGENVRIDKNNDGNPVYQVLTDYQGNTSLGSAGGDGWYRFMQFDLESRKIHFYTLNAYETIKTRQKVLAGQSVIYSDGTSDFDQPKGFSDFSLAIPVQVLKASHAREFEAPFEASVIYR